MSVQVCREMGSNNIIASHLDLCKSHLNFGGHFGFTYHQESAVARLRHLPRNNSHASPTPSALFFHYIIIFYLNSPCSCLALSACVPILCKFGAWAIILKATALLAYFCTVHSFTWLVEIMHNLEILTSASPVPPLNETRTLAWKAVWNMCFLII